jgi:hypothetical protein
MPAPICKANPMKSIRHIGAQSVSLPLSADNIVEFHAARLLLLLSLCGTAGHIDGLTKFAKLDFFVRYPDFYAVAKAGAAGTHQQISTQTVESAMVRHHYGPWDKRYYHILAYLEANKLIDVTKHGKSYRIALTGAGRKRAQLLAEKASFDPLVERMRDVKKIFGQRSGNSLKNLIYRLFDAEVGKQPLGQKIRQ